MKLIEKIKTISKKYFLIATTLLSSNLGAFAHNENTDSTSHDNKKQNTELKYHIPQNDIDTIISKIDTINKHLKIYETTTNQDSIPLINDTIPQNSILSDTLLVDSIAKNTIPTDSLALEQYRIDRFHKNSENTVKFLTLFENIKSRAYYDNVAKCYSIGLGFCYRKNGQKIKAGDRIKNEEDFFDMWNYYAQKHYLPHLQKYFKLEELTDEELIAITSFMFNCGPSVVGSQNTNKPTAFTTAFNKYKETKDETYLNMACQYLKARNKSRGKTIPALTKRRRVEEELLRGNILINETKAKEKGCTYLDLNNVAVGAFYSIGRLPNNTEELIKKAKLVNGKTYKDTLQMAFPVTSIRKNHR
jgi:GH24 family phage-related lysozyme (muramidase)